jgi:hypothetical protein
MFNRTLIPLAAVALVCGSTVAVAHAAISQESTDATTQATCTANPDVVDEGTAQQITVVCSVPKPPAVTVTSTATSTETASEITTETATATVTASPSASPAPTSPPPTTSTQVPTQNPPTPTATPTSAPSGFPDASNTGVPAGTALTPWTEGCTITSTVTIDAKTISCPGGLKIRAAGVVIQNSMVNGRIVVDTDENRTWSLTLTDSEVDAGSGDLPAIYNGNVTILRANIHGGHNGLECQEHSSYCSLRDSWIHDQWQLPSGDTHLGGVLVLGNMVPCTGTNSGLSGLCAELVHNSIVCDAAVNSSGGGCTGDINLLPHFGPLPGALIRDNLLGGNVGSAFCTYGGSGMEYPASHIVYMGNVFQRGTNGKCAAYGPVTNFSSSAPGNVWSGNTWDDGTPLAPGNSQVP